MRIIPAFRCGTSSDAARLKRRFWLATLLALATCAAGISRGWAQNAPVAPPPVLTEDMLKSIPVIPSDELAGLRQFTRSTFEAGHQAWMMAGTIAALFLVAPGLAFFYGGLLNTERLAERLIESLLLTGLLSLAWVLWTYSLAFSRNEHSFDIQAREIHATDEKYQQGNRYVGGWNHVALQGFDPQIRDDRPAYPLRRPGDVIPHVLFMAFQLGIFIAAAAPLMVALGNRLKLWVRMLFLLLWGTLVYAPIAYWIWGGGWHSATLDYAGGIVVQATVGFSALALALGLGRLPAGAPPRPQAPALPLLGAGTMLFWAGALVCNASHALAATAGSANACIATHLAACTGILGWAGWEWLVRGTASPTGICAGAVTGLFAIAPACGFVAPQSALLIGLTAGVVGQVAFQTVAARRDDHPLIVLFVLQGIAGVIGVMLTGVFATPGIAGFNRRGDEISGALSGNFEQLGVQAAALGAAVALAFVGTALIAGVIRVIARPAAQNGHSAASA